MVSATFDCQTLTLCLGMLTCTLKQLYSLLVMSLQGYIGTFLADKCSLNVYITLMIAVCAL